MESLYILDDTIIRYTKVPQYPEIKDYSIKLEAHRRIVIIDKVKPKFIDVCKAVIKGHSNRQVAFSEVTKFVKYIDDFFNVWLFTMYSNDLARVDALIPSNSNEYFDVITDGLVKFIGTEPDKEKISKLLMPLHDLCVREIDILKSKLTVLADSDKYKVKMSDHKFNNKITLTAIDGKTSIETTMIKKIYNKLLKQYQKITRNTDIHRANYEICLLMYRYNTLGINNQFAAMSDKEKDKYITDYNIKIELFACAFNNYCTPYCSLFYEMERNFGSLGNFFHTEPVSGSYFMNPPYITEIMNPASKHAIARLQAAKANEDELRFVMILPAWHLKERAYDLTYYNYIKEYPEFIEAEINKSKDDYKFYSYINDEYYNLTTVVTFILKSI